MSARDRSPVLVIGATGRVGREVVAQLRRAARPVRALTRRPATSELPVDVELAVGDLTAPETLEAAVDGVRAAFLVWTAPFGTTAEVVSLLARRVERIVLLSSPHQTPHPFFQQPNGLRAFHEELDRVVRESGVASTIVRPGMFAANAIDWWGPQVRQGDVVRWPHGSAETAPIDERDIAAVAVRALTGDGHDGGDYVVTGPASLSQAEQVAIIGGALGRPLRYHELTPDEFRGGAAGPIPPAAADMLLSAWGAATEIPAYVTSTVEEVTGTPARSFAQWAAAHTSSFATPLHS